MNDAAADSKSPQDVSVARAQRNAHQQRAHQQRAELAGMVAFTALGLWIAYQATELGLLNALGVGPGLFPLISALLVACFGFAGSIIWTFRLFRGRSASDGSAPSDTGGTDDNADAEGAAQPAPGASSESLDDVHWPRLWLAVAFLVAFFVFLDYLGFSIALGLLVFGLLKLVAARGVVMSAVIAIATASALAIGFGELLSVQLPSPQAPFLDWLG